MIKTELTVFQQHALKWKDGCGNEICKDARRVFFRGTIPCDVLFIGEAPGRSENVLGKPFVGPAGKVLDRIARNSIPADWRVAFTNLLCCIPRGEDGRKVTEPYPKEISNCSARLREFVAMASPSLVVMVGALAKAHVPQVLDSLLGKNFRVASIVHPAAILRMNMALQGLEIQKCEVEIRSTIEEPF